MVATDDPVFSAFNKASAAQPGDAKKADPVFDAFNQSVLKPSGGSGDDPVFKAFNEGVEPPHDRAYWERQGLDVSPVSYGKYDPAAVNAIVAGESGGNPKARTGSYYGVAQLSREEVEKAGTKWDSYLAMGPNDQLDVAKKHWERMGYKPEYGLKGLAMIQAAPAYLKKSMNGWDGIVYQRGSAAWRSNPGWRGADGEIRPSSITAYYAKRMPKPSISPQDYGGGGSRKTTKSKGVIARAPVQHNPQVLMSGHGTETTYVNPDIQEVARQLGKRPEDVTSLDVQAARHDANLPKEPETLEDYRAAMVDKLKASPVFEHMLDPAWKWIASHVYTPDPRAEQTDPGIFGQSASEAAADNFGMLPLDAVGHAGVLLGNPTNSKLVQSLQGGNMQPTLTNKISSFLQLAAITAPGALHGAFEAAGEMVSKATGLAKKAELADATAVLEKAKRSFQDAQSMGVEWRPKEHLPAAEPKPEPTLKIVATPKGPRYVSADGHPFTEERVPTEEIGVAKGMQYKDSEVTDFENMVSPKLKGVTKWDPSAAGIVSLWKDKAGKYWAMNAHHRLELANRVGQPDLLAHVYSETDGVTFDQAKAIGALQNLREGNGTAIDAAGVLRDRQITPEHLQEYGVPQRSGIARDALGLARLSDTAWGMVRSGRVAEPVAAAIGDAGLSEGRTLRALEQAEQRELTTRSQGEILAQKAKNARAKADIAGTQKSIFDEDVVGGADEDIHWGSETEVEDAVSKQLARDQKLFKLVAQGRAAGQTVLDVEAQMSAAGREEFARKMICTSDPVQEAIRNEAIAYENNPTPATLKEAAARVADVARSQASDWLSGQARNAGGEPQGTADGVRSGAAGDGSAAEFPAQGAEAFKQTVKGHIDAGNAVGIERLAEEHGIPVDEAKAIYEAEAASDPKTDLDKTLKLKADEIKKWLNQGGKPRGKQGGGTNIPGQIVGHLALFAIKAIRGGIAFGRWAAAMVGRFGGPITPRLRAAWDAALMARDEINNLFGGAMSTTRRIMPEIAQAAREFMGADSQGRAIWNNAKPFIDRIGGKGFFDNVLYPTLAQDRLYGIRIHASKAQAAIADLWGQAHKAGQWQSNINDLWNGLKIDTSGGKQMSVKALVHASGGGDIVEALLEDGKTEDAMQTAMDTLQGVIDKQNDLLTPDEYTANRQNPAFQAALDWYKEHVEPKMKENHERWGGVQTDRLGELDTYTPLVRDTGATATGAKGATFKGPRNMGNTIATGTSTYTIDPERVASTVIQRTKGSARAYMIKLLNERGLVRKATEPFGEATAPMTVGAKQYPTVRVNGGSSVPVTLIKNGQSIHLPGADSVLPEFLHKEIGQFLDRNHQPFQLKQNPLNKTWDILASAKVVGVTEPIAHGLNTAGYAASSQPLIGSSFAGKVIKNLPGALIPGWKTIMAFADRAAIDALSPEFYEDTVELARRGLLPTRAGKILGGGKVGAKFGPKNLVFGESGFDLRNRIALLRYAKENLGKLDPNSPAGSRRVYDFVAGAGTYTYGLDSAMERSLKSSRFSPFATAAKSKLIGGVKAALGTSPLPQTGAAILPARLMQIATGGAGAYVASWYMANKLFGNDPSKTRLGDIPVPASVPVIGGRTMKMGFAMAYTNAGMIDLGVKAYADASREGKSHDAALADMTAAWINVGLKPVAGSPALNTAMESAGVAPYVEPDLSFLQVGKKKGINAENIENALVGSIPFGSAIQETGIVPQADWIEKARANMSVEDRIADGLINIFAPGAMRPSGKQIDDLRLKALSDRDAAAKKGEGDPLSPDEAEDLARLKAANADANPKSKTKRAPTEADKILKRQGRTQSGSKRKARTGWTGMNERPSHRWDPASGEMVVNG